MTHKFRATKVHITPLFWQCNLPFTYIYSTAQFTWQ